MFVDIGVNLGSKRFKDDVDEVIKRALLSDVQKMIVTGTNVAESENAVQLIKQYPDILYSTAGIHPHHAKEFTPDSVQHLSKLLEIEEVVAVGECGLDFNRNFSKPADQLVCFEAQLELAVEKQLPVFLHQRDAHQDFVNILSQYIDRLPAAVAHCFTGDEKELNCYIDMGLHIGITGWICDERRGLDLKSIVNQIPLDKLMIETDAPYLLPRDIKPKSKSNRNEPAFLPHICEAIANCYQLPYSLLEDQCYQNSLRFFGLDQN